MSKQPYPIAFPDDLLAEIKRTAKETHLSMAEAVRQAVRFGLPRLRQGLSHEEDFAEAMADTWEKLGPASRVNYEAIEKR
jgi:hypothetical protein